MLGTYLTLSLDGSVIAETTDVNMMIKSKAINVSSHDTGLHGAFIGGKVRIALAGGYLLASSGANWDILWAAHRAGTTMVVTLKRDENSILNGPGLLVKLSLNGGDSGKAITGKYGLLVNPTGSVTVDSTIITVDSTLITTDMI